MQSAFPQDGGSAPWPESGRRPEIPDHELFRCIGRGAYGEVWLARNVFGSWRAVKVVYRDSFTSDDPYEREFRGIQRYEPVSRANDGLMDILQAGRQDDQGYFYYVMELADDARLAGPAAAGEARLVDPDGYVPATLASRRHSCRRLPVADCLGLGLNLTSALGHLHRHGLIHRDIKPSNIIFVQGVAKLADIGLVAEIEQALSFVGTEGFIPPEGPTSPQADLYSLGKVLYEVSMGKDRKEYPEPMTGLHEALTRPEQEAVMELNTVILKACAESISERYQNAEELHADLALLQSGKSVRWRRLVEKRLAAARKIGMAVAAVALLATGGWLYQRHQTSEAQRLRKIAEEQTTEARRQQRITGEMVARLQIQKAEGLLQSGASPHGLAWLAHVLRRHPDHRAAAERILAVLAQRRFFRPAMAPLPHPTAVTLARCSPDGSLIATAAEDGRVRFWNALTGQEIGSPFVHDGGVRHLSFSPDGRWVLTASGDGKACVVDVQSGGPAWPPFDHGSPVLAAAFSPDGEWIATGTANGLVRRFAARTGRQEGETIEFNSPVNAVQFSPENTAIAIATEGARTEIRGLSDGQRIHSFALDGPGRQVRFSPDGTSLAVALRNSVTTRPNNADWEVLVWDRVTGRHVAGPLIHDHVTSLEFSPDSTRLVTTDVAGAAMMWRVSDGRELFRVAHASGVESARFTADGTHFLTASEDHTARLWDALTGQAASEPVMHAGPLTDAGIIGDGSRIFTVPGESREVRIWFAPQAPEAATILPHDRLLRSAVFDTHGQSVLTTTTTFHRTANRSGTFDFDDPQSVILWDAATAKPRVTSVFPVPAEAVTARFSTAGPIALIAGWETSGLDGDPTEAQLWNMSTGTPVGHRVKSSKSIACADVSPDGSKAAMSSADGSIVIVEAATGLPLLPPIPGHGELNSLRFSPDGSRLVTASTDGSSRLIQVVDGSLCASPLAHEAEVWFAQFSPASDRVVTVALDATARIWSSSGKLLAVLRHAAVVEYAEFSPDGTMVATASHDRTARLWDAATGRPLNEEALEHARAVLSVRFSPDGRRVITASRDGTARLWDTATGLPLNDPLRHNAAVISATFSADGRRVVTASLDRNAAIWSVPVADPSVMPWLPEIAEAVAGVRLNDHRVLEPVEWEKYEALKARWAELPDTDPLARQQR